MTQSYYFRERLGNENEGLSLTLSLALSLTLALTVTFTLDLPVTLGLTLFGGGATQLCPVIVVSAEGGEEEVRLRCRVPWMRSHVTAYVHVRYPEDAFDDDELDALTETENLEACANSRSTHHSTSC